MEFAVLMSVYKGEIKEHLASALKSTIEQSFPPQEIVLVKDGELTPELETVISEFQGKYPGLFKIVNLPINQGLGLALRAGVENCDYEYIARMDSDDIARPDRFEKQVGVFEGNEQLDLVGSYYDEFEDDPSNVVSCRKVPLSDKEIRSYARRRNPCNHVSVMFKKSAVIAAGNYQHCQWFEDYYLWVRMLANGSRMQNIPESLVRVRVGKDMYKRRGGARYIAAEFNMQWKLLQLGFIGPMIFLQNVVMRLVIRLMPNMLRKQVYLKILR